MLYPASDSMAIFDFHGRPPRSDKPPPCASRRRQEANLAEGKGAGRSQLFDAQAAAEIDPRYRDRPYYVVPDGKVGAEAFAVIRDAMEDKDRVGLARVVIAHREHLLALEPLGKGILATTLRYDYEMRDEKQFFKEIASPRIPKEMLELAGHIIDTKASHFDPAKFKDQYEIALRKLVERKEAGKKIEPAAPAEKPDNVINLMDALRQSLGGGKSRGGTAHRRHTTSHGRRSRKRKAA